MVDVGVEFFVIGGPFEMNELNMEYMVYSFDNVMLATFSYHSNV